MSLPTLHCSSPPVNSLLDTLHGHLNLLHKSFSEQIVTSVPKLSNSWTLYCSLVLQYVLSGKFLSVICMSECFIVR